MYSPRPRVASLLLVPSARLTPAGSFDSLAPSVAGRAINDVSVLLATMQNDFFLTAPENAYLHLQFGKAVMQEGFTVEVIQLGEHRSVGGFKRR